MVFRGILRFHRTHCVGKRTRGRRNACAKGDRHNGRTNRLIGKREVCSECECEKNRRPPRVDQAHRLFVEGNLVALRNRSARTKRNRPTQRAPRRSFGPRDHAERLNSDRNDFVPDRMYHRYCPHRRRLPRRHRLSHASTEETARCSWLRLALEQ